jgi:hypothetical protein
LAEDYDRLGEETLAGSERLFPGSEKLLKNLTEYSTNTRCYGERAAQAGFSNGHLMAAVMAGAAVALLTSHVFMIPAVSFAGLAIASLGFLSTLAAFNIKSNPTWFYIFAKTLYPASVAAAALVIHFGMRFMHYDNWKANVALLLTVLTGNALKPAYLFVREFFRHFDLDAQHATEIKRMKELSQKVDQLFAQKCASNDLKDEAEYEIALAEFKEAVRNVPAYRFPNFISDTIYEAARTFSFLLYAPLLLLMGNVGYDTVAATLYSCFWAAQLLYTPIGRMFFRNIKTGDRCEPLRNGDLPVKDPVKAEPDAERIPKTKIFRLTNTGCFREGKIPAFMMKDVLGWIVTGYKVEIVINNDPGDLYYPETAGAVERANQIAVRAYRIHQEVIERNAAFKELAFEKKVRLLKIFMKESIWDPTQEFDHAFNAAVKASWPCELPFQVLNNQGLEAGDIVCAKALKRLLISSSRDKDVKEHAQAFKKVARMISGYASDETRFSLYNYFDDNNLSLAVNEIAERLDLSQEAKTAIFNKIKEKREQFLVEAYYKFIKSYNRFWNWRIHDERIRYVALELVAGIQRETLISNLAPVADKFIALAEAGIDLKPPEDQLIDGIKRIVADPEFDAKGLLEKVKRMKLASSCAGKVEMPEVSNEFWAKIQQFASWALLFERRDNEDSNLLPWLEQIAAHGLDENDVVQRENLKMLINILIRGLLPQWIKTAGLEANQQEIMAYFQKEADPEKLVLQYPELKKFINDNLPMELENWLSSLRQTAEKDPASRRPSVGSARVMADVLESDLRMRNIIEGRRRGLRFLAIKLSRAIPPTIPIIGRLFKGVLPPPVGRSERFSWWCRDLTDSIAAEVAQSQLLSGDYQAEIQKRQLGEMARHSRDVVEEMIFNDWIEGKLGNESLKTITDRVVEAKINNYGKLSAGELASSLGMQDQKRIDDLWKILTRRELIDKNGYVKSFARERVQMLKEKLSLNQNQIECLVAVLQQAGRNAVMGRVVKKQLANKPAAKEMLKERVYEAVRDELSKSRNMIYTTTGGLVWVITHELEGMREISGNTSIKKFIAAHISDQPADKLTYPEPAQDFLERMPQDLTTLRKMRSELTEQLRQQVKRAGVKEEESGERTQGLIKLMQEKINKGIGSISEYKSYAKNWHELLWEIPHVMLGGLPLDYACWYAPRSLNINDGQQRVFQMQPALLSGAGKEERGFLKALRNPETVKIFRQLVMVEAKTRQIRRSLKAELMTVYRVGQPEKRAVEDYTAQTCAGELINSFMEGKISGQAEGFEFLDKNRADLVYKGFTSEIGRLRDNFLTDQNTGKHLAGMLEEIVKEADKLEIKTRTGNNEGTFSLPIIFSHVSRDDWGRGKAENAVRDTIGFKQSLRLATFFNGALRIYVEEQHGFYTLPPLLQARITDGVIRPLILDGDGNLNAQKARDKKLTNRDIFRDLQKNLETMSPRKAAKAVYQLFYLQHEDVEFANAYNRSGSAITTSGGPILDNLADIAEETAVLTYGWQVSNLLATESEGKAQGYIDNLSCRQGFGRVAKGLRELLEEEKAALKAWRETPEIARKNREDAHKLYRQADQLATEGSYKAAREAMNQAKIWEDKTRELLRTSFNGNKEEFASRYRHGTSRPALAKNGARTFAETMNFLVTSGQLPVEYNEEGFLLEETPVLLATARKVDEEAKIFKAKPFVHYRDMKTAADGQRIIDFRDNLQRHLEQNLEDGEKSFNLADRKRFPLPAIMAGDTLLYTIVDTDNIIYEEFFRSLTFFLMDYGEVMDNANEVIHHLENYKLIQKNRLVWLQKMRDQKLYGSLGASRNWRGVDPGWLRHRDRIALAVATFCGYAGLASVWSALLSVHSNRVINPQKADWAGRMAVERILAKFGLVGTALEKLGGRVANAVGYKDSGGNKKQDIWDLIMAGERVLRMGALLSGGFTAGYLAWKHQVNKEVLAAFGITGGTWLAGKALANKIGGDYQLHQIVNLPRHYEFDPTEDLIYTIFCLMKGVSVKWIRGHFQQNDCTVSWSRDMFQKLRWQAQNARQLVDITMWWWRNREVINFHSFLDAVAPCLYNNFGLAANFMRLGIWGFVFFVAAPIQILNETLFNPPGQSLLKWITYLSFCSYLSIEAGIRLSNLSEGVSSKGSTMNFAYERAYISFNLHHVLRRFWSRESAGFNVTGMITVPDMTMPWGGELDRAPYYFRKNWAAAGINIAAMCHVLAGVVRSGFGDQDKPMLMSATLLFWLALDTYYSIRGMTKLNDGIEVVEVRNEHTLGRVAPADFSRRLIGAAGLKIG